MGFLAGGQIVILGSILLILQGKSPNFCNFKAYFAKSPHILRGDFANLTDILINRIPIPHETITAANIFT